MEKSLKFKKAYFQICNCGSKKLHFYFYASPDSNDSDNLAKFPIPFFSIASVTAFLDAHVLEELISVEQKEELLKYVKEAGLQEQAEEEETFFILAMKEMMENIASDGKVN